jgi:hypothetical protein
MISRLMAFFVMLLTMAHEKSGFITNEGEGIFEATISGFKRSTRYSGCRNVGGKQDNTERLGNIILTATKLTYVEVKSTDRTIDATEEEYGGFNRRTPNLRPISMERQIS